MTHEFAIHNNIDPKSAMYVRVPTPENFKSTRDKDAYWDKERVKWVDGYSGVPGPLYFYIQECMIPDARGKPIRPYWRDGDQWAVEAYMEAYRTGWDVFYLKRREWGASSLFGGGMPVYHALLYPGSTCIMTSADKDRIRALFGKKLMTVYNKLHPDLKSPKARTSQFGYLLMAEEVPGYGGKKDFKGLNSEIWCKETVKTPTAFETYRAVYGLIDEIFLHKRAGEVRSSAYSCFMDNTEKIGTMVMAGSCGIGTTAGIEEGKKIYADSMNLQIITHFISGATCMKEYSTNGHSDIKGATEWIEREREKRSKAEDKKPYWTFIAQYPLYAEEILNMTADTVLPQELLFLVNQAEKNIADQQIKDITCNIERSPATHELRAIPDMKGKFHIIKYPEKGHTYGAGTDPIPFGNASLDDGSDLAIIIKDRFTNQHVAYYKERVLDSAVALHNCILLQDLYFGARTMIELNRGEVLLKEYMGASRTDLLSEMPTNLGIKFEKRKYKWGVYKNNHIEDRCNKYWFKWLYANAANIIIKLLCDETKKMTKTNTDLLDAALMEIIDHENFLETIKKASHKPLTTQVVEVYRDAHGVTQRRLKEIKINMTQTSITDIYNQQQILKTDQKHK